MIAVASKAIWSIQGAMQKPMCFGRAGPDAAWSGAHAILSFHNRF